MPAGSGTPAGSVPVDVLDAQDIVGLLARAAAIAAALAGDPASSNPQDWTDRHEYGAWPPLCRVRG